MKRFYTVVIALICCFAWAGDVHATHAQGADLSYRFVSYNPGTQQMTYEVTATFYRDCSGTTAPTTMPVNISNAACGGSSSTNVTLPIVNGLPCPNGGVSGINGCEVSQLCAGALSNSRCQGGSLYPGVQKYVYRGNITLPGSGTVNGLCNQWYISTAVNARNPSDNVNGASTDNLYVEAMINNTIDPSTGAPYVNSSTTFGYDPVPFVCSGYAVSYNNGAVDADGDSLVFQLIAPLSGHNSPLSFNGGYTASRPIIVSNNQFVFNTASGQIDFTPSQQNVDVLALRVLEYRNGVLVGSVIRDVQVKILGCNVPAATQMDISNPTNANIIDSMTVQLCPGSTAAWDIEMASANGSAVEIKSNILTSPSPLPGATLTTVTITPDHKVAHFSWTPAVSDTGCHYYQVTTNTKDCPIEGNFTKSYRVCVFNKVTVSPHEAIYCGTPIQLTATGGSNSRWLPTAGLSFPRGLFDPLAAPSVTTKYTFSSDCGSDTALIRFNPPFTMDAGTGGTICRNNFVQLNASVDNIYAPYQILWTPATGLTDPITHAAVDNILNPVASPPVTTTYTVKFTANTGCVRTDTVKVTVNGYAPPIQATANPTMLCPGQLTALTATANPECGLATTPCTGTSRLIVVGTGTSTQGGSAFVYPSPYGNYYKSARHQYLFHAGELAGLLGSGGQITSLGMQIGNNNGGSTCTNFTIRIGCVDPSIDSLTGYVNENYLSTVYVANYSTVNGWNNHTLQTPYNWDGESNLVVDVCFINTTSGNINPKMKYTTTPFKSVWCTFANDQTGQCGFTGRQSTLPANSAYYERPNFQFNMCTTSLDTAHLIWTSSTGLDLPNPVDSNHTSATPRGQTTYQVTLLSQSGCNSSDYVTIIVDTTNRFRLDPDTFICSVSSVQLHARATGSANPNTLTYTWSASTGAAPPSGVGLAFANPTVTPVVTTLYTCVVTGTGMGCILRDTARVTIGSNIPVNKLVDSITCSGANNGRIRINMNAGVSPYTYTWSPAVSGNPSVISGLGPNTYYLTVVDNGGCRGYDTTTLLSPAPLVMDLDSTDVTCAGGATGTVTANVTGGRAPYRYTWSPAQPNTRTLTGLIAGTYRLTVTDTSGCTTTAQIVVNQPAILTATSTKTNLTGAGTNDGTVKIHTAGGTPGYTYTWSPSSAAGNTDTAHHLSPGTYTTTVCDSKGCCVTVTTVITVPPPIDIVFTVGNVDCFGNCNGSVSSVATGGVLPYTYAWSGPGSYTATNDTILNLCAGVYTLTVTDANGVSVSENAPVQEPPAITIAIDSVPITCFGANNGQLDATPVGGTPVYTVVWSAGADPLTSLSPGTYIVTVTDANSCTALDTAYLGEPTQIVATLLSTDSVKCFGESNGVARIATSGGRPPYTYQWNTSASVVDSATDLVAGTFRVTVTDASGCTATVTGTIDQPLKILVNVTTLPAHCATSNDGSATATVSNGTAPYTYRWDGTPGTASASALSAGSHTVVVTDVNGCSTQQALTIGTQYTLQVSLTKISDVTCYSGTDGAVSVTVANGNAPYSYQWRPDSTITGSPATGLRAGIQTVTVTDLYGCIAKDSIEIYQPTEIFVLPTFTNPLCTGDANGKIWLNASGGNGPPYTFTYGGNTYQMTDTITGLPENTPTVPSYNLVLTDPKGCTQNVAVILKDPPMLQITDQVTPITCANASDGAISVSATGGTPAYTYIWSSGGAQDAVRSNLAPGSYTISVTDANGCVKSLTETLLAPPRIVVDTLIADSTNCPGSSDGHIRLLVSGGTPGATVPYQYSLDNITWQDDPNFYDVAAGVYHVYARDGQMCVLDTTVTIYEPLAITLAINPEDTTIIVGGRMPLTTLIGNLTTQNINTYAWSPAMGLSCIDCPNPVATPYETTQYQLMVNYGKNCFANAGATVAVAHGIDPYIPNAFSPNGDDVNDVFTVYGTKLKTVTMRVFNRWGEKVFDSGENQWAGWDGMYKGVGQPTGVYVYVVQVVYLDGVKKTREGSVTLIR